MTYKTLHKARAHHNTRTSDGTQTTKYSPYEIGMISGSHRDMMAVIADSAGFDGLGFDTNAHSNDDSWHVFSTFNDGRYVDSLAVGGALDNNHALEVARTQLDHLGATSCAMLTDSDTQFDAMANHTGDTWSIDSIAKLMNNESQDKPFLPVVTAAELNAESKRVCFDTVQWNDEVGLISHGGKSSLLHLDLARADTRHDLINTFDLTKELASIGAEPLDEGIYDALMDSKNRLDLLKDRLFRAMAKASIDGLSVENVTQTKPFKRQGVANIAFVFNLSDGQSISIWFHNPDSTPSKLLPSDIMISWKWMLNKRDVTAVLSPKQGDNVKLPVLARRMMLVASKNSKRFKAAQARKIKDEQALIDAQKEVDAKNATIAQLDIDIVELNAKIDAAMKAPKPDEAAADQTIDESLHTDDTVDSDEVEAVIYELHNDFGTSNEFWEKSVAYVQALTEDQFERLSNGLTDANYHSENIVFRAKRTGVTEYVDEADSILQGHIDEGSMTEDLLTRRTNLFIKIDKALFAAQDAKDTANKTKVEFTDKGEIITEYGESTNGVPESVTMTFTGEAGRIDTTPKPTTPKENKKTYPPVEHAPNGENSYIAYMNGKKKDHWLAWQNANGRWAVAANNAQTRARSPNGMGMSKYFDDLESMLKRYPAFAGIETLIAENEAKQEQELEESQFPGLFLERNAAILNEIGVTDDYIQINEDDALFITEGVFEGMTLSFADSVCKLNAAASSIGAQIAIADYNPTGYQDGMFDALNGKSKPTYGITAQISKDDVHFRADIDANGECKILRGSSGSDVLVTVTHKFTDNTDAYKAALEDAFGNADASDKDEGVSITGQEIEVGEEVDFKTAKKNAMAFFDENLRDKTVFCPAIDNDVLLRRRGGKHITKANNTFREKLKLVAAIPEMIKKGKYGSFTAVKKLKGVNIDGYYVLIVDVMVGDTLKAARVVLEKNNEGEVLYDIGINKKEALAALGDTITNETFDDLSGSSQYQDSLNQSYQEDNKGVNQFDKMATEGGLILNIFFDEDDSLNESETIDDSDTDNKAKVIEGRANESTTVKGTKISSNFALVEAKDLIASHDSLGVANPKFPQELQPRDRSDKKSVESIEANAKNLNPSKLGDTEFAGNGAPIVGDDLVVESGNGRAIAIISAYDNGDAGEYKEWLAENAESFGFKAEQVNDREQPVLVRIRKSKLDRVNFAIEANLEPNKYLNDDADEMPVATGAPVTNNLADRINAIDQAVSADDFKATDVDANELSELMDQTEGDEVLAQKLDDIFTTYQDKLVAIGMQALTELSGSGS